MSQIEFDSGPGEDAHHQMMDMSLGFAVRQIIRTTVELSIADHLTDGPLTAYEVDGRENGAPDTIDATDVRLAMDIRERSLPDFYKLLNRAGLRRTIVDTTGSAQSVIEAVAA